VNTPIADSYWVEPGRFLAGEYPGARDADDAARRIELFVAAGVTSFVDLTEEDEGLRPYRDLLGEGIRYVRSPIRDNGCPTADELEETLAHIDAELAGGQVVYLHCWGGHGRTGLVVGCWLVRRGAEGIDALARIKELRRGLPDALWQPSPQTPEQRGMVLDWASLDAVDE
jgi:hypothetical protein